MLSPQQIASDPYIDDKTRDRYATAALAALPKGAYNIDGTALEWLGPIEAPVGAYDIDDMDDMDDMDEATATATTAALSPDPWAQINSAPPSD